MVDPVPLRDFDLLRPIGEGATGSVWYGVHRTTGTPVAVKTLHRFLTDPDVVALFEREARAIAALDHPHVVALLDFGTVDAESAARGGDRLTEGAPFLVVEHVSGGTIGAPPISTEPALHEMLVVMLSALGHAHSRGVLHRDLKLSNVLRAGRDDVRPGLRLADFGIAWFARGEADDLRSVGTPSYMAPEQLVGEASDLGPWTDLYALASMTWRLVCGLPPVHEPRNRAKLLQRKQEMDFEAWTPRFEVPNGLEQALLAALQPEPDRRPQNAAALARLVHDLNWSSPAEPERDRRPPTLLGAGLPLLALRPPEPVGRERALAQLHGALRRVTDTGKLEVVSIEAAAGLDRDAVVRHFCDASEEEGPAVAVRLDGQDPDLPARVLRRLTGTAELTGEALSRRLERFLTERGEESELALQILTDVLSNEPGEEGERQQERERRVIAARVLALEAQRQPLIVVLSGRAGYGRGIGRQLVRLARLEALPALLVLVEPEGADDAASLAPLLGHPRHTRIELRPLSRARLRELADSLLPMQTKLRDLLVDRADGRPETLRAEFVALAESDGLTTVRGRFRLRPGVSPPAQEDARNRAIVRLDAIGGAPGRAVAELLAQLDGPCAGSLLETAAQQLGVDARPALRRLARAGIAKQTREEWSLVSAELAAGLRAAPRLAPEVVASALLNASHATQHTLLAERQAHLLTIADRLQEALSLRLRIVRARERRGDRDRAALEIAAAESLVERLGLHRDHPEALELALWTLRHRHRTRSPGFIDDGHALAERALVAGQHAIAGEALRLVSAEHRSTGHPKEARDAAEKALDALRDADDRVTVARVLHTLGLAWRELGLHDKSLDAYERAYGIAKSSDRLAARRVLADRADLLQLLGRWEDSSRDIERSEKLTSRNESARNRSVSTVAHLQLVLTQGRLDQARQMADKLVSDLRYLGIDSRLASVLLLAGEVDRFRGDLERAEDHYRQALLMFEALGSPLTTLARANLGMVRYARGELHEAFEELSQLLAETEAGEVKWMVGAVRVARAPAAAGIGRWDLVRDTLDELEEAATSGGRIDLDTWWVSGQLLEMASRAGDAGRVQRLERLAEKIRRRLPPRE